MKRMNPRASLSRIIYGKSSFSHHSDIQLDLKAFLKASQLTSLLIAVGPGTFTNVKKKSKHNLI